MSDQMKDLAEVQARDLEIDALREEREQTPEELTAARARQQQLQAELGAKQREHEAKSAEVRSADLELGTLEERRRSAANSALTAESPKEASQFQNQELQFATRVQELEEDLLPLMEDNEALAAEVADLEGQLAELDPAVEELARQEEERVARIDERIEAGTRERSGMVSTIEARLLSIYEQVRRARKGVGLAEVLGTNRCSGCNVHLPIHVVQKVRKNTGVVRCPSCGRILHFSSAD